jgi:hypothetical protein
MVNAEALDGACAADAALRQRLAVLLKALDQADSLLDKPLVAPRDIVEPAGPGAAAAKPSSSMDTEPSPERPGTVIGPYKLLQEIGEGGMGTVYMAE